MSQNFHTLKQRKPNNAKRVKSEVTQACIRVSQLHSWDPFLNTQRRFLRKPDPHVLRTRSTFALNVSFCRIYTHSSSSLTERRSSSRRRARARITLYAYRRLKHPPRGSDAGQVVCRFGGNCGIHNLPAFFRSDGPRAGGWMDNEKTFSLRTPRGLYITS